MVWRSKWNHYELLCQWKNCCSALKGFYDAINAEAAEGAARPFAHQPQITIVVFSQELEKEMDVRKNGL